MKASKEMPIFLRRVNMHIGIYILSKETVCIVHNHSKKNVLLLSRFLYRNRYSH